MNLFEKAIINGDLLNFAIGKGEYYIMDREYGEHSIFSSWSTQILPFYTINRDFHFKEILIKMLNQVLFSSILNNQEKAETILYHLHVYYYLDSQNKLKADSLKELNFEVNACFEKYLSSVSNSQKIDVFKNAIKLIQSRGGLSSLSS